MLLRNDIAVKKKTANKNDDDKENPIHGFLLHSYEPRARGLYYQIENIPGQEFYRGCSSNLPYYVNSLISICAAIYSRIDSNFKSLIPEMSINKSKVSPFKIKIPCLIIFGGLAAGPRPSRGCLRKFSFCGIRKTLETIVARRRVCGRSIFSVSNNWARYRIFGCSFY